MASASGVITCAALPADAPEENWVQTIPGQGFAVILRLYGPLEPWFDKTWKPGDLERLD